MMHGARRWAPIAPRRAGVLGPLAWMRRGGWVLVALTACGGDDSAAVGAGWGTTLGNPTDEDFDDACEAAGGAYGIVAGPLMITSELGMLEPGTFSKLGLLAHDDGLWAMFDRATYDGTPASYTVALDLDGLPIAPAVRNEAVWAGGRVWPGPGGAVVTYCRDQVPGLVVVDARGEPQTVPIAPAAFADCMQEPAAAWTESGDILLSWIARGAYTSDCTTGTCIVLGLARLDGTVEVRSLHPAGDWGVSPTSSVALGPEQAMVVALAWTGYADETAVISTLTDGFEPSIHWLTPPSDGEDTKFSHARAMADESDGFFVFVGGYGPSMGRMHIDGDGRVIEPLTELPVFHQVPVYSVHLNDPVEIVPRAGGSIVYGSALQNTQPVGLLTAIDPRGEPRAQIVLPGRRIAIATHTGRTWALHDYAGGSLQITELGCALGS